MRSALIQAYPGPNWKIRVQEMPTRQIVAVYKNLERTGNLKEHKWKKTTFKEPLKPNTEKYEQLTIWDFL
jgi:hypothetical protein